MMRAMGPAWNANPRVVLLSVTFAGAALTTPALADPVPEGVYFGAAGGANFNDSGEVEINGANRDLDTDLGFVGLANFGYAFGNGVRTEAEGSYRRNSVDSWGSTDLDGNVDAWSAMFNALYDFDTGTGFTPYVGAGVGMAYIGIDAENKTAGVSVNDRDVAFAYQAIVGVGYDVAENLAITADYRFFHAPDLDNDKSGSNIADGYANHALMLGVRYAFGGPDAPPPAEAIPVSAPQAPAPPPPAVPTSYLVFFEFASAELTDQATNIVDTAATNAISVGRTRIALTGHADRSGSSSSNMVLSQRRAATVMERLISQGIPREEIAVYAEGEDMPMMPTEDGVRAAQNRRVEIVLM